MIFPTLATRLMQSLFRQGTITCAELIFVPESGDEEVLVTVTQPGIGIDKKTGIIAFPANLSGRWDIPKPQASVTILLRLSHSLKGTVNFIIFHDTNVPAGQTLQVSFLRFVPTEENIFTEERAVAA